MVVLLVVKTTNYELHGAVIEAKVAEKRVPADALVRLQTAHRDHYQTLTDLRAALQRRGIHYLEVSRERDKAWPQHYDVVVTIGGDGTLLAATHHMKRGGLIFGLRSSPSSVGYLCCAGQKDIEHLASALANHSYAAQEVERLQAEVRKADSGDVIVSEPILNDFLYTNANPAATTRYRLTVGGVNEVHRSSGIWVATAAGSTAAVLAAGGERRPITDRAFQYRVRELYRLGHTVPTLEAGLFDPDQAAQMIEIENRCESAILALDGQHGTVDLEYGDIIRFARAAPLKLVTKIAGVEQTH